MSLLSRCGMDFSHSHRFAQALAKALRATQRPGGVELSKITVDASVVAAGLMKLLADPRGYLGSPYEAGDLVVVRGGKSFTLMRRIDTDGTFTEALSQEMVKKGLLMTSRDDIVADVENTRRDRVQKGLFHDTAVDAGWDAAPESAATVAATEEDTTHGR